MNYAEVLAEWSETLGVSGIVERGGVKAPAHVMSLLRQTGLTFLGVQQ